MRFNKKLLSLAVAGSLLTLAGCSSSSGGGTTTTTTTTPLFSDSDVAEWFDSGDNNSRTESMSAASFVLGTSGFDVTEAELDLQDVNFQLATVMGGSVPANFVDTDYIGAFPQNTAAGSGNDWTADWTIIVNGNNTVWQTATAGTLGGANPTADNACPTGTTDVGDKNVAAAAGTGAMDVCQLPRRVTGNLTLTNDNIYTLQTGFPGTYVGDGEATGGPTGGNNAILTIEAGTLILGSQQEGLIVTRGSQIDAQGTAADPIVMGAENWYDEWVAGTNDIEPAGAWAGLALMGNASSNEGAEVAAEGNIGFYAGSDDADNSGILQYVVIRDAGNDIDGNGNELNGFTLFGVGSGTTLDHIQVHNGLDDGIEHFGSTDHMTHIVLTDNNDDSFDWGQGYRGSAQFGLIMQSANATAGDRMIEADNDGDNPDATPVSRPVLANFTFISDASVLNKDGAAGEGILMRRGTGFEVYNSVMEKGADKECMEIDGDATWEEVADTTGATAVQTANGQMENVILRCVHATAVDADPDA